MPGEKRDLGDNWIAVIFGDGDVWKSQFINKAKKEDVETSGWQ